MTNALNDSTKGSEERSGRRGHVGPRQDQRVEGITGESSDCPVCCPN